jgi:uncharacterized protein YkwD
MYTGSIGRKWWGGAVALLLASSLVLGFAPARSDAKANHGRRMRMVSLTNTDREQRRRDDLGFNARISRYAKHHSLDMAHKGYLYHSDEDALSKVLSPYDWSIGGENVGVGSSLDGLEAAFMASKEHRQNILRKSFQHMAVGIARVDGRLWVTVIFYG